MSKKQTTRRGTYVSRSIYQKVVEENKLLKRDLRTLVTHRAPDFNEVFNRWYDHFQEEDQSARDLRALLTQARGLLEQI